MSEEPKTLSEKLRAARDEFNDLATKAKAAAGKLESAMWEAQVSELRAKMDKVLDQFIPTVDKSPLKGHDIVFLINKSQDMGQDLQSPIGSAISVASTLYSAVSGHDTKVSALLWEGGAYTKAVALNDFDRQDKARDKTNNNAKDLLPAMKEIMVANTPDKQDGRKKHFIIISPGTITDNLDHSAQMINTAMQLNPRITFDFITVGTAAGNVTDLIAKMTPPSADRAAGYLIAATHEDINGAVMSVLKSRFKGDAPAVETPKVVAEAPKAEPVVMPEAPKAEAPKAAEVAQPAAPEQPKSETPVVATAQAAVPATPGSKKKWYKVWGRNP
jgi:hypothetical protein